jgi:hypothetical protein
MADGGASSPRKCSVHEVKIVLPTAARRLKLEVMTAGSGNPHVHKRIEKPDTAWHTFRVTADFQRQEFVGIGVDASSMDLRGTVLAQRDHSRDAGWATDSSVKLSLTTESLAAFPANLGDRFTWTTQFRNVLLTALNPHLGLKKTGNLVVLTWPASTGHFFIESTDSLAPPVRWLQLTVQPVQMAGEETMTVAAPVAGNRFVRLTGP